MADLVCLEIFQKLQLYHISMNDNNHNHKSKCCIALGNLYKDGSERDGILPDALNAIKWYLFAFQLGKEDFLEIALVYENGLHPYFLPDKMLARKIYNVVIHDDTGRFSASLRKDASRKDKEIAKIAYSDLDRIPDRNRDYIHLPTNIVSEIMRIMPNITNQHHTFASIRDDDDDLQEALWNDLEIVQRRKHRPTLLETLPDQIIKNDSQNVHSSSVNNAAIKTLDDITKNTKIYTSFDENSNEFLNSIPLEEGTIKVLHSLKNIEHSRFNRSEQDVFNIIWSRIKDPINSERRDEMTKILAQNMASGVEHSMIVCSTGKIMRMIGSFDAIDKSNISHLKPEWAIKEEIGQVASKVRNDVISNSFDRERKAYDSLDLSDSPDDSQLVEGMIKLMREKLTEECIQSYVESNILTKESLDTLLEPYLESF